MHTQQQRSHANANTLNVFLCCRCGVKVVAVEILCVSHLRFSKTKTFCLCPVVATHETSRCRCEKKSISPRPRLRHHCAASSLSRTTSYLPFGGLGERGNLRAVIKPALCQCTEQFSEHKPHFFLFAFVFRFSHCRCRRHRCCCRSVRMRNK